MQTPKLIRYLYYRCVRIHGRPREVAMGMAIGLAVGMTPTMGIQMPIAIALSALLGQSKIAAAVGVWITNPVTAPVIYFITYALGASILGQPLTPPEGFLHAITHLKSLTWQIFVPLCVGGMVSALPVGLTGYWLTYQAVVAYRLKVRHRRANRLHRWKWHPQQGWQRVVTAEGQKKDRDHG